MLTASATFGPRAMTAVVSHRGVLYVVGGFDGKECLNDVWASVGGQRWTRVCHGAPWLPRHSHELVSDGSRYMYLVGGEGSDQGSAYNDVWRSVDGSLWELVCVEGPWSPCYNHAAVLHTTDLPGASAAAAYGDYDEEDEKPLRRTLLYVMGGRTRSDERGSNNHGGIPGGALMDDYFDEDGDIGRGAVGIARQQCFTPRYGSHEGAGNDGRTGNGGLKKSSSVSFPLS